MKQGWEIKKLGDITTSINGLWTGKKPPFTTIAVIRNTNFTKDCKLDTSDIAYIDVEVKQYASRKLYLPNELMELDNSEMLCFCTGVNVIKLKKFDYSMFEEDPHWSSEILSDPNYFAILQACSYSPDIL